MPTTPEWRMDDSAAHERVMTAAAESVAASWVSGEFASARKRRRRALEVDGFDRSSVDAWRDDSREIHSHE